MNTANIIKKNYCRPAVYIDQVEMERFFSYKLPTHYHIERYVWLDSLIPEYRVVIPEVINSELFYTEKLSQHINTRFITYKPTGKQVYDNTFHPAKAVVFEYELEQYWNIKGIK